MRAPVRLALARHSHGLIWERFRVCLVGWVLAAGVWFPGAVSALDTDADDYVASPAGTNLGLLYFQHVQRDSLYSNGNQVPLNAGLDKKELDLGRRLVDRLIRERLPDDVEHVRDFFQRKSAYSRLKVLLIDRGVLRQWYDFEQAETRATLREWCAENEIEPADPGAAQSFG